MSSKKEIRARIDEAVANSDEEDLENLLVELYRPAEDAPEPFAAAIELKPSAKRKFTEFSQESDAAVNWANEISRARRRIAYNRKTKNNFSGLRIVSEGDSWFQYPLILEDVIDALSEDDDKAILSLGAAGDLVSRIADSAEYLNALEAEGSEIFLLSAGGNDLLGAGALAQVLNDFERGSEAEDLVNREALQNRVDTIIGDYRRVIDQVAETFPNVQIFGHGYDLPYPFPDGKWLGVPLKERGIPRNLGRRTLSIIVDAFNDRLHELETEIAAYTHIDLRGIVDRGRSSWYDELHPKNKGFERAADAFRAELEKIDTRPERAFVSSGAVTLSRERATVEASLETEGISDDLEATSLRYRNLTKEQFIDANSAGLEAIIDNVNRTLQEQYGRSYKPITNYDVWVLTYIEAGLRGGKVDINHRHSEGERGLLPLPSNVRFWNGPRAPRWNRPMPLETNLFHFYLYLGQLKNKTVTNSGRFKLYTELFDWPGISGNFEHEAKLLAGVVHGYFYSPNYRDRKVPFSHLLRGFAENTRLSVIMRPTRYVHAGTNIIRGRERNIEHALGLDSLTVPEDEMATVETTSRAPRASEIGSRELRGSAIAPPSDEYTEVPSAGDIFSIDNQEAIMATIVLDPGHGGRRSVGGSSWNNARGPNGLLEKTVTLDVAVRTKRLLEERGYDVHLTREDDTNLSLKKRARTTARLRAPVFVSIHFNGYNNRVQGTETFVHNRHRRHSANLCRAVQRSVAAATGYKDRNAEHSDGIKRAGFGVLSPDYHVSQTACVLLEVSFMDTIAEERRLRRSGYKSRIAEAIADGIENYLGVSEGRAPESAVQLDEIGDAIELSASREGMSVPAFLTGSRAEPDDDDEYEYESDADDMHAYDDDDHDSDFDDDEDALENVFFRYEQQQAEPEEDNLDETEAAVTDARAGLRYSNQNAIRKKKCTRNIETKLVEAVTAVYGADYSVSIYSGGQDRKGRGRRRTGSIRHDDYGKGGRAADVYVYDQHNRKVTGLALAKLGQYWLARRYGGVGHELNGGGIHLDEWKSPPPGGGMFWTYGYSRGKPWGAKARRMLARGARGMFP